MKNIAGWMNRVLVGCLYLGACAGCQPMALTGEGGTGIDDGGVPAVTPTPTSTDTYPAPVAVAGAAATTPKKVTGRQPTAAQRLDIARRADKLLAMKPTTDPGREYVNRLRTSFFSALLEQVRDVDREIAQEDLWKWESMKLSVEMGEAGPTWPVPKAVKVPRVPMGEKVVMDGDLSDPAWEKAFTWTESYKFNELKASKETQTFWKVLWDADYLYVGFGCVDDDIVSKEREHDDTVYQDDSVELYISPDERFRGYWEAVVNVDNSVFDAIEVKKLMEWGLDMDLGANVEGLVTRVTRVTAEGPGGFGGKAGYCVEMAMPWSAVLAQRGQRPRIGDVFSFMLVRIQVGKGGKETQGYAPVPLIGWGHNIWNRVKMELGE